MSKELTLVHGWDPNYYNNMLNSAPTENMAWSHRTKLLQLLESHFDLKYYNLPGFCGEPEPDTPYDVEDFTDSFATWMQMRPAQPSAVLGYSFGGVVALDYKARYQSNIPVILVSPAILRQVSAKSGIASTAKKYLPAFVTKKTKSIYQYLFSRYYRAGTDFLRTSYDMIVRRDLSGKLLEITSGGVLLVYGSNDTSTPFNLVEQTVKEADHDFIVIPGGGHGIGQTHPNDIVQAILTFMDS